MTRWRSSSALASAVLALLLAHSGPTAAQEPLPACRAADAPAVYDPILILPTTTLEQIEALLLD